MVARGEGDGDGDGDEGEGDEGDALPLPSTPSSSIAGRFVPLFTKKESRDACCFGGFGMMVELFVGEIMFSACCFMLLLCANYYFFSAYFLLAETSHVVCLAPLGDLLDMCPFYWKTTYWIHGAFLKTQLYGRIPKISGKDGFW
jgi:hypothetical protein